jgi:hypothetical protein
VGGEHGHGALGKSIALGYWMIGTSDARHVGGEMTVDVDLRGTATGAALLADRRDPSSTRCASW